MPPREENIESLVPFLLNDVIAAKEADDSNEDNFRLAADVTNAVVSDPPQTHLGAIGVVPTILLFLTEGPSSFLYIVDAASISIRTAHSLVDGVSSKKATESRRIVGVLDRRGSIHII